jgi:uncharacterized membrane protein
MIESRLAPWMRPHRAFAVIALVFGTALVLLIPPFQSQDEIPHFLRAYQISEGIFISRHKDLNGLDGEYLPASLQKIISPFTKMFSRTEIKASVSDIRQALGVPLDPRIRVFFAFANTAHYCPTSYMASCVGITAGRLMGLPPLAMLYLGRETNLIAWTFLGFFSLRWAPAIARPLFLLLLMPMSLYLAASVSGDPTTSGLAALFTALICRYFQKSASIDGKALILLAAISIPLSVSKYVYLPMLGLLLLIPARNFGGSGRLAAKLTFLAALNVIALFIWVSASSTSLDTRITGPNEASPPLQLQWLERHPERIPGLVLNTFRIDGWLFVQSYVGVIGSFDQALSAPVVAGYVMLLLVACWSSDTEPPLPTPFRAAIIVLPIVTIICLVITLLSYCFWSPPAYYFIDGINGRYFIPLTPAIIVLLCSAFRRLPRHLRSRFHQDTLNLATTLISLGVCVYLLAVVWNRYYGLTLHG